MVSAQIELVDFGATREYSTGFMDNWMRLLQAAAADDRDACIAWSLKLGYLTGAENEVRSLPLPSPPLPPTPRGTRRAKNLKRKRKSLNQMPQVCFVFF